MPKHAGDSLRSDEHIFCT